MSEASVSLDLDRTSTSSKRASSDDETFSSNTSHTREKSLSPDLEEDSDFWRTNLPVIPNVKWTSSLKGRVKHKQEDSFEARDLEKVTLERSSLSEVEHLKKKSPTENFMSPIELFRAHTSGGSVLHGTKAEGNIQCAGDSHSHRTEHSKSKGCYNSYTNEDVIHFKKYAERGEYPESFSKLLNNKREKDSKTASVDALKTPVTDKDQHRNLLEDEIQPGTAHVRNCPDSNYARNVDDDNFENALERLASEESVSSRKPDFWFEGGSGHILSKKQETVPQLWSNRESKNETKFVKSQNKITNLDLGIGDKTNLDTNGDFLLSNDNADEKDAKTEMLFEHFGKSIHVNKNPTFCNKEAHNLKRLGKEAKSLKHHSHSGFDWDSLAAATKRKAKDKTIDRTRKTDVYSFDIDEKEEYSFEKFDKQVLYKRRKMSSEKLSKLCLPSDDMVNKATPTPTSSENRDYGAIGSNTDNPGETEQMTSDLDLKTADSVDSVSLPEAHSHTDLAKKRAFVNFEDDNEQVLNLKKWDTIEEQNSASSFDMKSTAVSSKQQYLCHGSKIVESKTSLSSFHDDAEDADNGENSFNNVPTLLDLTFDNTDDMKPAISAEIESGAGFPASNKQDEMYDGTEDFYVQISRNNAATSDVNNGAGVWIKEMSDRTDDEPNPLEHIDINRETDDAVNVGCDFMSSKTRIISVHNDRNGDLKLDKSPVQRVFSKACHSVNGVENSLKHVEDRLSVSYEQYMKSLSHLCDSVPKSEAAVNHSDLIENVTHSSEVNDDQMVWNETLKHFILQNLECGSDASLCNGQDIAVCNNKVLKRPSIEEKMAEEFLHRKLDLLRKHYQSNTVASQVPKEPMENSGENHVLDLTCHHSAIMGHETMVTSPSVTMATSQSVLDLTDTRSNTFPAVIYSAYNGGELATERTVSLQQKVGLGMLNVPTTSEAYDNDVSAILDEAN